MLRQAFPETAAPATVEPQRDIVTVPFVVEKRPRERSAAEILYAAADLIEKHGWTRGWFHDFDGSYCAVGALRQASGYGPYTQGVNTAEYVKAADVLSRSVGVLRYRRGPYITEQHIWRWNDWPIGHRSRAAVVRKIRKVAAKLERG